MPKIYNMKPTVLLPLRRKVCWGFFRLKNPTASAVFEKANLGTKSQHATPRPTKPPRYCTTNEHSYVLMIYTHIAFVVVLPGVFLYSNSHSQSTAHSNWLRLFSSRTFPIHTPQHSQHQYLFTPSHLWRWNTHSAPKRRHIQFSRRKISHNKAHNKIRTVGSITQYSCCVASHLLFRTTPSTHSGRLTKTRHLEQLCR